MVALLSDISSTVRNNAGTGYDSEVKTHKRRAVGYIWADNFKARKDNLKNNTLLKALHK